MMDASTVQWIITGLMGLIMWFWKRSIDENEKEIAVLKTDIQTLKDTRLHKDDFKEFKQELRLQFDEIKVAIRDLKPHVG